MGICEHRILDHQHPVMHWEHNDRFPGQTYDSPRDLSPNLPPLCDTITSMNLKIDQNLNQSTILGHIAPPTTPSNFQHVINNNNNNNITQICTSSCSQSSMNATSSLMPQNTKTAAAISNFDLVKTPKLEPDSSPLQFFQQQQQSLVNDTEICAGCNLKIYDRYYLQAVDRRWHINCLQCFQCRMPLDGETSCYSHDGNIYCKKDYQRMKRCSRCQLEIASTELVMRAREFVFHIRCFSCIICRSPLTKGDHFGLRDGAVFCRLHYDISLSDSMNQDRNCLTSFPSPDFSKHIVPSMTLPNSSESLPHCRTNPSKPITGSDNTSTNFNYFNGSNVTNMDTFTSNSPHSSSTTPRQKGRPRKRKPKDLDSMHNNLDQSNDYVDMGSFGRSPLNDGCDGNMSSMHGSSSRAKRMRTSFKHHQLRTMKSYFAINHNPDAKDLKQLAQKTGLQKRVLQVWFQNARAKWRRMIVKQGAKSPLNSSDKCSGPSSDTSNLSDLDMYAPPGTLSGNNLQAINPHSPQFSLS